MSNFNIGQFLNWAQQAQNSGTEGGDNKNHLDRNQTEKRQSLEDVIRNKAAEEENKDKS